MWSCALDDVGLTAVETELRQSGGAGDRHLRVGNVHLSRGGSGLIADSNGSIHSLR
jgi:hypothetical protein